MEEDAISGKDSKTEFSTNNLKNHMDIMEHSLTWGNDSSNLHI